VIFGTFYMPAARLPEHFGNGEHDFPEDFWGQFVHPFRKKKPPVCVPAETTGAPPRKEAA